MPELPEVEAVRAGLARHVLGRRVERVEVFDARPLRRQAGGPGAFVRGLEGRVLMAAVRRGKFLWLPLDDGAALVAHLGMSGQLLVRTAAPASTVTGPPGAAPPGIDPSGADPAGAAPPGAGARGDGEGSPNADLPAPDGAPPPDLTAARAPTLVRDLSLRPRHLRVRLHLGPRPGDPATGADGPVAALDLVDQRMLGGLHLAPLVPTADGAPGGRGDEAPLLPAGATHIARDLLDPHLDEAGVIGRMRSSRRAVKTLLLDQGIVSGIGNIYADEGLWAARVHGLRRGEELGPRVTARILRETAGVMRRALEVGGTSFDALYVDVEGAAGFFARRLAVYGRAGLPCRRCGTPLRSEVIGGRSHAFCPRCQTRPRSRP